MRTSIRGCEIVSNLKNPDGSELFSVEKFVETMKEKSSCVKEWAVIVHDKDTYNKEESVRFGKEIGALKPAHAHGVMRFEDNQPQHIEDVASWLNIPENFVQKFTKNFTAAVAYLIHANAPDKYQYSIDEVIANFDVSEMIDRLRQNPKIEEVIKKIADGEIREFNLTDFVDEVTIVKNYRLIENAFHVRTKKLLATQQERNTEVIFISGGSGVGKTTLAKTIAQQKGLPYYVSSGSNDLLDGYQGQQCLIVDDVRPDAMGISDFLKLLDNNTATSVKSRYRNKYVNCDLIILTSVLSIDDFYENTPNHEKEPVTQLKRRCQTYIQMDSLSIRVSVWNKLLMQYSKPIVYENDVLSDFVLEEVKKQGDGFQIITEYLPFLNPITETKTRKRENSEAIETPQMISDSEFSELMPQQEDDHDT